MNEPDAGLITEKGIDKLSFIKNLEVLELFTYANIFDRDFQLVRYANYHSTFSSSVQFGKG
jgi:hypothetical protein